MNSKCTHYWGAISLLFLLLTIQVQATTDPCNGRFELYEHNDVLDINVPIYWQHENYAAVVTSLSPKERVWKLQTDLLPFEGNYFLLLSTGRENVLPDEPNYAKVWQTITIEAGDKLTGVYFFGTRDYIYPQDFNDWAEIKLVPTTDPNLPILLLVSISVSDVGDYNSMSSWKRFEHTFDANQAGTYDLTLFVSDYIDSIYDTYFAVDGLILCDDASGGGDINLDCTTDFQDFAILASDWLCDCNDPNNYNDPNDNCRLDPDLTGDGPVDTNDLQVMSEHWLEGTKE